MSDRLHDAELLLAEVRGVLGSLPKDHYPYPLSLIERIQAFLDGGKP